MREKRERNKLSKGVKTAIRLSVIAAVVLALALFNAFLPFRSLLPTYALPARETGELRLHFLDVGQGDCTVVEFPEGDILIVDAGSGAWSGQNALIRYVKSLSPKGISLVATHADHDHIGGLKEIVELFGAERCIFPFSLRKLRNTAL